MPNDERALLEICTASVADVVAAETAGADRVELNSALLLGGLTPSPGCVQLALEKTSLPVVAMARPRASGFHYADAEFETLISDVRWLVNAGVAGVAFGVLNERGEVDPARTRMIVEAIGPDRAAVFHRAFDLVARPREALETLIDCGVSRVMTSGGRPTALEGQSQIADLVAQAAGRIEILAAGGIRSDHVGDLVNATGVEQVHAGPGCWMVDASYPHDSPVNFYGQPPAHPAEYRCGDGQGIRDLVAALRR